MRARALAAPRPLRAPAEADPSASTSALATPKRAQAGEGHRHGVERARRLELAHAERLGPRHADEAHQGEQPARGGERLEGGGAVRPRARARDRQGAHGGDGDPGAGRREAGLGGRNARSDAPGPLLPRTAAGLAGGDAGLNETGAARFPVPSPRAPPGTGGRAPAPAIGRNRFIMRPLPRRPGHP